MDKYWAALGNVKETNKKDKDKNNQKISKLIDFNKWIKFSLQYITWKLETT